MRAKPLQSCPTLCDPTDCSLPGPSVHGILQARILEWVAMSISRGSSQPRDRTQVSYIFCTGQRLIYHFFTTWKVPIFPPNIMIMGNPLQYSCLDNSLDRGAWRATVHRVTESQTNRNDLTHARTQTHTHTQNSLSSSSDMATYCVELYELPNLSESVSSSGKWAQI